jgi:hypothetical protein
LDFFKDADVISSYTRKQAIEDGALIDVSQLAQECGFKYPVALTSRVYGEVVVPPIEAQSFQDDIGRLWDILICLKLASKKSSGESEIKFNMIVQNEPKKQKIVTLKAICGPGDDVAPVITVMFPEED